MSTNSGAVHSLPQSGCFFTNDNLRNKVTDDGKFKPFYGDTVIFSLDKDAITWLSQIQNETYRLCGNILSDKLRTPNKTEKRSKRQQG